MTIKKGAQSLDKRSRCDQICKRDTRLNHNTCILCRTKSLAIVPSQSRTCITQAPQHLTTTSTQALLSLLALDGFALSRQREKVRWKEIKTRSAVHSVRWVTLGTAGSIPHRQFTLQYKRLMSACPSVLSNEGEASFAYAMNEMDRYSSWMEEGRKLDEKREGREKEGERHTIGAPGLLRDCCCTYKLTLQF